MTSTTDPQPPFDLDRIGGVRALRALVDAVLDAGDRAAAMAGDLGPIERKDDESPVTIADRETEARLRDHVDRHFPEIAFLGEETHGDAPLTAPGPGAGLRFVVDPIDGTRAFVRGLPSWSVLVGLEEGGRPVLGIAYLPAAEELYVAVAGDGATGNGRPLRVSDRTDLSRAAVGHGGLGQFFDTDRGALLGRLARGTDTQRGFADFANYAQLLAGRLDLVVDPGVAPWDVCAATVIVREAGGQATDLSGGDPVYGAGFLATNGHLHQAALDLLAGG